MKKILIITLSNFLWVILVLAVATTGVLGQKTTNKTSSVEEDTELAEVIKNGENVVKGTEGVSYTVLQNILKADVLNILMFNVSVDKEQKVMIEVFDKSGKLTEVIYNDYMPKEKRYRFTIDADKLNAEIHYLRVTTEDLIEHHEFKFVQ